MDSAVWLRDWWSVTTAGNRCSGVQRLSVTTPATDAVVCTVSQCLDSWQRMQWYAPSLSVTIAGDGYSGMPWTLDLVKHLFLSEDD